ncbi:MAG: helix-turn-helix domain-containing protein [Acutalibacteraceae bacterium]
MNKDINFESSLSIEEVEENFKDFDFFTGLMAGLNEALAYEKGTASAETFARKASLPEVDTIKLRSSLSMTQKSFAALLGVSKRTVEAWECGRTNPTPTAKKLMFLIENDHSLVDKLQL